MRAKWKLNLTICCSPNTSLDSHLTQKYIFKVIQSYWEAIESQLLQFFAVPNLHWGQMGTDNTFYKTYNAIEKQLKAKLYQFLAIPILHGSHIWPRSTFYKTFRVIENQFKTKFLQPPTFNRVTSDQKIQFIRHWGYWKPVESQILQIFPAHFNGVISDQKVQF